MKKFSKVNEDFEQESLSGSCEPVLKQKDAVHYVSESEMVDFIEKNSDMEWNDICDFIRLENIAGEEGKAYW